MHCASITGPYKSLDQVHSRFPHLTKMGSIPLINRLVFDHSIEFARNRRNKEVPQMFPFTYTVRSHLPNKISVSHIKLVLNYFNKCCFRRHKPVCICNKTILHFSQRNSYKRYIVYNIFLTIIHQLSPTKNGEHPT